MRKPIFGFVYPKAFPYFVVAQTAYYDEVSYPVFLYFTPVGIPGV